MRRQVEVTVDLTSFEDDDIREEARSRGLHDVDGDPVIIADLAHAIVSGNLNLAIHYLGQIVAHSPPLQQAVEVGRRRVR